MTNQIDAQIRQALEAEISAAPTVPDHMPAPTNEPAQPAPYRRVSVALVAVVLVGVGIAGVTVVTRDGQPAATTSGSADEETGAAAPAAATISELERPPSSTVPATTAASSVPSAPSPDPAFVPSVDDTALDEIVDADDEPSFAELVRQLSTVSSNANAAIAVLTRDCMTELGFELRPYDPPWLTLGHHWNAPTSGYLELGFPATAFPNDPEVWVDGYEAAILGEPVDTWTLPPDQVVFSEQARGGDVFDGCFPVAQQTIIGGGDPAKSFMINDLGYWLERLNQVASDAVISDSEVRAASARWVECMSEAGHAYTTIDEPWREFVDQDGTPSAEELETATADSRCKSDSGLSQAGDKSFEEHFIALLEGEMDTYDLMRAELAQIDERATQRLDQAQ